MLRVLPISSWGQAWAVGLQDLALVSVGSAGAQEWHLRRVPEPLELILPVVLLADARVDQGSIGTPVVSISSCFSLFNKAIVLDGSHRWVPGLRSFLSFLLKPSSNLHNGPRALQYHTCFMAEHTEPQRGGGTCPRSHSEYAAPAVSRPPPSPAPCDIAHKHTIFERILG